MYKGFYLCGCLRSCECVSVDKCVRSVYAGYVCLYASIWSILSWVFELLESLYIIFILSLYYINYIIYFIKSFFCGIQGISIKLVLVWHAWLAYSDLISIYDMIYVSCALLHRSIFKLNSFIEDNFLCTYKVQLLESTVKYSNILFNIEGMRTFMYRFPNKGKNVGNFQSSDHPINAAHFWVYRQQCAFPPQSTPLSVSDNIPIFRPIMPCV